jgi:energy-coupling factor transporter ATP-binding protein EcfA2
MRDAAPYASFVLAVDDLGWTRHWLGRLRCDLLSVQVARSPESQAQVRLRAIESKSASATDEVAMRIDLQPYREGADQVLATLDALWEVMFPGQPDNLVSGLRFAAFVEHLASVALSSLHPFDRDDIPIVNAISRLSNGSLGQDDIELEGIVVVTQYRAAVNAAATRLADVPGRTRPWPVTLVRAGSDELDALVGFDVASVRIEPSGGFSEEEASPRNVRNGAAAPRDIDLAGQATSDIRGDRARAGAVAGEGATRLSSRSPTEQDIALARDLFAACRQRNFPVEEPDVENVMVGPSLLAVAMALRAGAALRPIEAALDDLAREVGVTSVSVENDPFRPFHVRFLVERRQRDFPELPLVPAPVVADDRYLGFHLGQTLEGDDYLSFASDWPHMLIGGTTGSGKTTFIKSLLRQVNRSDPSYVQVAVIDGKGEIDYFNIVEDGFFVPQFPEVKLGHQEVTAVFEWLVEEEIPRRRTIILERARQTGAAPAAAKQQFIEGHGRGEADPFPALLVFVDEFAEIMLSGGAGAQQFEQRVQQVAQTGRSVLVHVVLATQRPDATVVRGAIKTNLDARIALRVPTHHDSMTILGRAGAERLLGRGDLLFQGAGGPAVRLQGYRG